MFSATQSDSLGTEFNGGAGIGRRFGICTHRHAPRFICPAHDGGKSTRHLWLDGFDTAEEYLAGAAIDGDDIAFMQFVIADIDLAKTFVKTQIASPRHAGAAHAARHNRRMACHPAARGQDACCRMHAVDIFRACLLPDKDHLLATACQLFGAVGTQHDFAGSRPG